MRGPAARAFFNRGFKNSCKNNSRFTKSFVFNQKPTFTSQSRSPPSSSFKASSTPFSSTINSSAFSTTITSLSNLTTFETPLDTSALDLDPLTEKARSSDSEPRFPSLLVRKPTAAPVEVEQLEQDVTDIDGVTVNSKLYKSLIANKRKIIKELSVVDQFINNLMKDGKKELARKQLSEALVFLMAHINKHNTNKPESAIQIENSVEALERIIELASPLLQVVSQRRGAKVVATPRPLNNRRRKRTGIIWIIDAASIGHRKRGKSSAKGGNKVVVKRNHDVGFSERLGNELFKVLAGESNSVVLGKRVQVHNAALLNKSNILLYDRKLK